MKQLVRVSVDKLLGSFNHKFDFPLNDEFVILHGPNGVGKTRLLELIDSVLRGQRPSARIPFSSIRLDFDDTSWIEVRRSDGSTSWASSDFNETGRATEDTRAYQDAVRDLMEQGLIRRVGMPQGERERVYRDAETGERLTAIDAVERYADEIDPERAPVPSEVRRFVQGLSSTLVEVNRLRFFDEPELRDYSRPYREKPRIAATDHYAKELARQITMARAEHALQAQKLDRTYPKRLLEGASSCTDNAAELADLERSVESLRSKLEKATLLESETPLASLRSEDLQEWQRAALRLHYDDTSQKLQKLEPFADRLLLFLDLVGQKLSGKTMRLDDKTGYSFDSPNGPLLPSDLSSGEQHEIVMAYRLIFDSTPGQLVLIDEPEVSLHVRWQRQFLDDLERISRLDGIRFVIATHSPQIVGSWADRLVTLGDVE